MRKISLERARAGVHVARTIQSLDGIVLFICRFRAYRGENTTIKTL